MKRTLAPWLAAIYCAFLALMPVFGTIVHPGAWWQPAFYCFLPMCFYYAGIAQKETNREIDELRNRIAALETSPAA
jgi:hypothetical protein